MSIPRFGLSMDPRFRGGDDRAYGVDFALLFTSTAAA
jgi:hypothetical protein